MSPHLVVTDSSHHLEEGWSSRLSTELPTRFLPQPALHEEIPRMRQHLGLPPDRSPPTDESSLASSPLGTCSNSSQPRCHVAKQEWEDRKDVLWQLYMQDNNSLKDVKKIMWEEHGFNATESMYKKQFSKWEWKKYQTDNAHGPNVRWCRGKTQRRKRTATNGNANDGYHDRANGISPDSGRFQSLMVLPHINWGLQITEEIFRTLPELIHRSSLEEVVWRQRSRFDCFPVQGHDLSSQIAVASESAVTGDNASADIILRHAFSYMEVIASGDDISIYGPLFMDIPLILLDYQRIETLKTYLDHLCKSLSVRKPNRPITQLAFLMQQLCEHDVDKVLGSIERLYYIAADSYAEIQGADTFNSIERRMEAMLLTGSRTGSFPGCRDVFESLEVLLDDAMMHYREAPYSTKVVDMEVWLIEMKRRFGISSDDFVRQCHSFLERVQSSTPPSLETRSWLEWKCGEVHYELFRFYFDGGDEDGGLLHLEECVKVFESVMTVGCDEDLKRFLLPRVAQYRNQLVES